MELKVVLSPRNGVCYAEGIYSEGKLIVKKGGKINLDFADHIRGGKKAKSFRNDPNYVDGEGNIINECVFSSPSTAAQFVTGRSTNGYEAWRVDGNKRLGDYLKEKGLR